MGIIKVDKHLATIDGVVEFAVNPNAGSYGIQLQAFNDTACTARIEIVKASGGAVSAIRVGDPTNEINLLTDSIPFDTNEATTAAAVVANIQANTKSPFSAVANGAVITLTAKATGGTYKKKHLKVLVSEKENMEIIASSSIKYPGVTLLDPASGSVTGTYTLEIKAYPSDWYQSEAVTNGNVKDAKVNALATKGIRAMKVTTAGIALSADKVMINVIHYS